MSKQLTAVITGASKGIGADLARCMLDEGYRVISVARHAPDFSHDNLSSVEADLLDEQAVAEAAAHIASEHDVTHFIQNAGLIWPNLVEDAIYPLLLEDVNGEHPVGSRDYVLHFAADHEAFRAQLEGAWRLVAPGGLFFARLGSRIGLEDRVEAVGGGRYLQPDGRTLYLVSQEQLLEETERLGGRLVDPIKTTVVQGMRCMTTWVMAR